VGTKEGDSVGSSGSEGDGERSSAGGCVHAPTNRAAVSTNRIHRIRLRNVHPRMSAGEAIG
jgi:hypothetical protein